jgi:hypothetical protein
MFVLTHSWTEQKNIRTPIADRKYRNNMNLFIRIFKEHSLGSVAIRFRIQDNIAQKMPLVYWMGLQREISTYGGQYSTQNAP